MDELTRLLDLVNDLDPQVRRYAIGQIEVVVQPQDLDDALEALRGAMNDPVPLVSHQANRTMSSLLRRSFGSGQAGTGEQDITVFEDIPIDQLREAGFAQVQGLLDRLLMFAGGKDTEVARRAIIALGKVGDPKAIPVLGQVMRNPHLAKVGAIALAQFDSPDALVALLTAAQSEEPILQQHALLELGRFRDAQAATALAAASTHPTPTIRANVAMALGDSEDFGRAIPPLLALLDDREIWVAMDAIRSLGRFRRPEVVNALALCYKRVEDGHVRASIVISLGRLGDPRAVSTLADALENTNDRVRANAVEAVAQVEIPPEDRRTLLEPLWDDPNNRVRANVAVALSDVDPERAQACVAAMLENPDVWFRSSGAYALGKLQTPWAVVRLVTLLNEESSPEVLAPAIKSLEYCRDATAIDPILKLLEHPQDSIRQRAASLLGRVGGHEVLSRLADKYLIESNGQVRAALINSIGLLAQPREMSLIVQALEKDTESRVQANCIETLAEKGGLGSLAHVRALVSSTHNRIKANAVLALFSHGEFEVVPSLAKMLDASAPKQFYSAIYVVGEIGRRLRYLHRPTTSLSLLHALKNLMLSTSVVSLRSKVGAPIVTPPRANPGLTLVEKAEKVVLAMVTLPRDQALNLLKGVGADDPILALLVLRYQHKGDMPPAYREVLEKLAARERDFLEPDVELANHFGKERDAKEMVRSYLSGYQKLLGLLAVQLEHTRTFWHEGKLTEALASLKDLARTLPLSGDVHGRLGRTYLSLKLPDPARRHLFLAHLENPLDLELTYDYACACLLAGEAELTKALCLEIHRCAPATAPVVAKARRILATLRGQEPGGGVE